MIDNESGEDYLEAVLQLASSEREVHSVDVARKLGVSKPAVTKAMKILRAKGYVKWKTTISFLRTKDGNTRKPCTKSTKISRRFYARWA